MRHEPHAADTHERQEREEQACGLGDGSVNQFDPTVPPRYADGAKSAIHPLNGHWRAVYRGTPSRVIHLTQNEQTVAACVDVQNGMGGAIVAKFDTVAEIAGTGREGRP